MKNLLLLLSLVIFTSCLQNLTDEELKQSYQDSLNNEDWSKSLKIVNEGLRRNPNDSTLYYNKALCLKNIEPFEHHKEIIENLEIFLKGFPISTRGRLLKYINHYENGEYQRAIQEIARIEKYFGISSHTLIHKAFAYFLDENYSTAAFYFEEALSYPQVEKMLKILYYYKIYSKYFGGNKEGAQRDITLLSNYGLADNNVLMKKVIEEKLDINSYNQIAYEVDMDEFYKEIQPNIGLEYTYTWQPMYQRMLWQSENYQVSDLKSLEEDIEVLNLTSAGITVFPEELKRFKKLKILGLSRNKIKNFDKLFHHLANFENLEYLELNYVNLKNFPSSISKLTNLKGLSVEAANIRKLPKEIGTLENLSFLNVGSNGRLTDLPTEIKYLKNLNCLDVSGSGMKRLREEVGLCYSLAAIKGNAARIQSIPNQIGNLRLLRSLNLGHNKIMKIPESIGDLYYLHYLSLGSNEIEELPQSISNLKNLITLGLEFNRFKEFPEDVLKLEKLRSLWLHNSNFKRIPISVGQLDSLKILLVDHEMISQSNIDEIEENFPRIKVTRNDGQRYVRGPKRKN